MFCCGGLGQMIGPWVLIGNLGVIRIHTLLEIKALKLIKWCSITATRILLI